MSRRLLSRAFAASLALAASCAFAQALELRIASGAPPAFPAHDPAYTTFIKEVAAETNGEITARHIGMDVANLTGMVSNLQDGTLDVGNIIASYFPADFPHMMLVGELSVLGDFGNAMAASTIEFYATCDDCQAEMKKVGLTYLATLSTSSFELITARKPVRTTADIKGMRIRSTGANTAAWLEAMGAIAINVPFNEEYQALSSGLADGTLASPAQLISNRLSEIVKYYTKMSVLTISSSPNFPMRAQTYAGLTEDQRKAVIKAATRGAMTFEPRSRQQAMEGIADLTKRGGEIVEPDQELLDANAKFRQAVIQTAIKNSRDTFGIADAEAKVMRYVALVEKWNKIVEPIQDDPRAIADKVWEEVWSKVDFSKYGL